MIDAAELRDITFHLARHPCVTVSGRHSVCMLCVCLPRSPVTRCACVTEPGQRSHLHHLLPPVPGDAVGQAAEPRGGHQNSAVDLHQVVSGERRGGWVVPTPLSEKEVGAHPFIGKEEVKKIIEQSGESVGDGGESDPPPASA